MLYPDQSMLQSPVWGWFDVLLCCEWRVPQWLRFNCLQMFFQASVLGRPAVIDLHWIIWSGIDRASSSSSFFFFRSQEDINLKAIFECTMDNNLILASLQYSSIYFSKPLLTNILSCSLYDSNFLYHLHFLPLGWGKEWITSCEP